MSIWAPFCCCYTVLIGMPFSLAIIFILVLSALLDVITSASYIVDLAHPPLFAGCTNIGFVGMFPLILPFGHCLNSCIAAYFSVGYSFSGDKSPCEAWIPIIIFTSFNLAAREWILLNVHLRSILLRLRCDALVLGYLCFLVGTMIIRRQRGHRITWTATVRDTDFLAWKTDQQTSSIITKFWPWWLVRLPIFG